ncbi:MAG: FAD:protein FMN transferase [Actinobacteria bacterium]|nr:MAG: FAD:protein FMN transferase [Actinomycetota bacterium]
MPAAERLEFRVMGSDATVVAVGGGPGLAQRARQRLDHLEGLWSRFRPDSEVSRMNAAGGRSTEVSAETIRLVGTAVEAWSVTRGAYDPTVLGDVLRAGYTVSFESLRAVPAGPLAHIEFRIGAGGIRVDALNHTVELPPGVGFDPGGIGKGLAADIVVEELMAAGAQGACVNVGGDLRVCGTPPDSAPGSGWAIDVDDPFTDGSIAVLGLADGGVATSSRLLRRWTGPGGKPSHHLIDPRTGKPADSGLATVTVVAARAWQSEMLSKAVFLTGATAGAVLLDDFGAAGLLVTDDGSLLKTANLASFLGLEQVTA